MNRNMKLSFFDAQEKVLSEYFGDLTITFRGQKEVLNIPPCVPVTGGWTSIFGALGLYSPLIGRVGDYDPDGDKDISAFHSCVLCGSEIAEENRAVATMDNGDEIDFCMCKDCACSMIPYIQRLSKCSGNY